MLAVLIETGRRRASNSTALLSAFRRVVCVDKRTRSFRRIWTSPIECRELRARSQWGKQLLLPRDLQEVSLVARHIYRNTCFPFEDYMVCVTRRGKVLRSAQERVAPRLRALCTVQCEKCRVFDELLQADEEGDGCVGRNGSRGEGTGKSQLIAQQRANSGNGAQGKGANWDRSSPSRPSRRRWS